MKNINDFVTKKEYYGYLVKNKAELINFKKATLKHTDAFLLSIENNAEATNKMLCTNHKDDIEKGVIRRTIIGNTYNWMDSSDDVLLDGCFKKSIEENFKNIFHLHDHQYQVDAKVGKPCSIYEKKCNWTDLGILKNGMTECLMMDSDIYEDYNKKIFKQYINNEILQHSVGMNYIKIELAINDSEEKEEYAVWLKHIGKIGNIDKVMEQGYFWAVSEGKLREISCVLVGANELTPTIDNKKEKNICLEIKDLQENLKNIDKNDKNIVEELKNLSIFVAEIITPKKQPSIDTDLKKPIDINQLTKNFKL